jgi:hypothetical protein
MGDVTRIHRSKCRCGWYLPVGVRLEADGTDLEAHRLNPTVHFRCPSCAMAFHVSMTQRTAPVSPSAPSLIALGPEKG